MEQVILHVDMEREERFELTYSHYQKYPSRRALEFCSSRRRAEAMARAFSGKGVPSAAVYIDADGEFSRERETTNMQKPYKMLILETFYHNGEIQMEIEEKAVLCSWKQFFSNGTNWKDLKKDIIYEEYQQITDRQHLSNAKRNPIRFLKESGKGFFVEKEGVEMALREELRNVVKEEAFRKHMKDIIEYRTMDYYRRRYTNSDVYKTEKGQ